jgi:hypothetical protein
MYCAIAEWLYGATILTGVVSSPPTAPTDFFRYALGQRLHNHGECIMGEQGKKDRSTREKKKEPQMTLKEKRQAKKDKAKVKKSYE